MTTKVITNYSSNREKKR